jgi:hypothetical protein|tara:strand:+ start:71 stop:946 length:876 start_codon:yes stop_codon:yes gene_type:complete
MKVIDYLKNIGCNEIYDDKFAKSNVTTKKLGSGATQQWVNFYDKSLFAYAKGGHRILRGLVESSLHKDEINITKTPMGTTHYIPITDPLYHFYGGYFSSTFKIQDEILSQYYDQFDDLFQTHNAHILGDNIITTGDIVYTYFKKHDLTQEQRERFLFDIFDSIMNKIIKDEMVYEEHMCGMPLRLIDAYKDTDFDLDKIVILDLQRHGVGLFIENFWHLSKEKLFDLYVTGTRPSFAYQSDISIAFLKWQRWNSKQLMSKFHNEYCLYDQLRNQSIKRDGDFYKGLVDVNG